MNNSSEPNLCVICRLQYSAPWIHQCSWQEQFRSLQFILLRQQVRRRLVTFRDRQSTRLIHHLCSTTQSVRQMIYNFYLLYIPTTIEQCIAKDGIHSLNVAAFTIVKSGYTSLYFASLQHFWNNLCVDFIIKPNVFFISWAMKPKSNLKNVPIGHSRK